VKGLDAFAGEHPPVAPVFFAFRIMVGVGLLMLAVSWIASWQLARRGEPARWMARVLVPMSFSGWVAVVAGWYVTEIGRQPWLVQGVLTTAQAASSVAAPMIAFTLAMYLTLYAALAAAYVSVVLYLARKAAGKEEPPPAPATMEVRHA
jgi:cytochrome d ubiquinol oxidase subunit I